MKTINAKWRRKAVVVFILVSALYSIHQSQLATQLVFEQSTTTSFGSSSRLRNNTNKTEASLDVIESAINNVSKESRNNTTKTGIIPDMIETKSINSSISTTTTSSSNSNHNITKDDTIGRNIYRNNTSETGIIPDIIETKSTSNSTTTSNTEDDMIERNIYIQMRFARKDRLGSNIVRPLYLMSYANCYRQTFCIQKGRAGLAEYFPAMANQTCPKGLGERLPWTDNDEKLFDDPPLKEPGVYAFKRNDKQLNTWQETHKDCAFDDVMRKKWGRMIVDASLGENPKIINKTLAAQNLFQAKTDPKTVTVAINIRRGDFLDWGRKLHLDQQYVILLRHLRFLLNKAGRIPEVHLFSEDYGMIHNELNITRNWTMYEGLVEHYHLVPDMRTKKNPHAMNMDLNLRDWRHFVQADILIIGGSFSRIPGLGRPLRPNPKTGLPLTIEMDQQKDRSQNMTTYSFGWSKYNCGVMPDKYALKNLPQVFAQHDTVPVSFFMDDLMDDWNATYLQNNPS